MSITFNLHGREAQTSAPLIPCSLLPFTEIPVQVLATIEKQFHSVVNPALTSLIGSSTSFSLSIAWKPRAPWNKTRIDPHHVAFLLFLLDHYFAFRTHPGHRQLAFSFFSLLTGEPMCDACLGLESAGNSNIFKQGIIALFHLRVTQSSVFVMQKLNSKVRPATAATIRWKAPLQQAMKSDVPPLVTQA